jgi:hypothetical protein
MDNPSGMAVIESIAELIDEQFDLVGCHGGFVLAHVFFEIIVDQFKNQIQFFLSWYVDDFSEAEWRQSYLTMLG